MAYCTWTFLTEDGNQSDVYVGESGYNQNLLIVLRGGSSFEVADESDAAQMLKKLKGEGYNVPQYAIAALEESAKIDD
jgi:hypothetical protein